MQLNITPDFVRPTEDKQLFGASEAEAAVEDVIRHCNGSAAAATDQSRPRGEEQNQKVR